MEIIFLIDYLILVNKFNTLRNLLPLGFKVLNLKLLF
jgi:hypothetical protein